MNKLLILISLLLGSLMLASCQTETEPADPNAITGIVWQWESVNEQPTGNTTTVPDQQSYTIVFNEDSTFTGQADCNSIAGTYSTEGGFTITLGPTTLAFCGEASLDTVYLDLLSNVVAGGPDGTGGLALETPGGQMRMLFSNGGTTT